MPFYTIYSLRIRSPLTLWHVAPDCATPDEETDIDLFFSQANKSLFAWEKLPWSVMKEQSGSDWHLSYSTAPSHCDAVLRICTRLQAEETTVFFGRQATQIWVRLHSERADTESFWVELSGWILGSVLGYAVSLRGMPTLHGSVVAVDGQAIGLLGVSGAGKSTLAGAFWAAGHAILADDHLVVRQDEQGDSALPGPPRLRLWPTSMPVIDTQSAPATYWTGKDGKHLVAPGSGAYCSEALPLAVIYVLMPRDPHCSEISIEELSPSAALNALMNQRFGTIPLSTSHTASTFNSLAALAQRVPVRLLYRPHGLETLPAVVAAIREDALSHDW